MGALGVSLTSLCLRKIAAAAPRQSRMPAMPSTAIVNNHNLFPRRQVPHTPAKKAIATNEIMRFAPGFRVSNSPGPYLEKEIFMSRKRVPAVQQLGVLRRQKV